MKQISKTTAECYRIQRDGEHATIVVQAWQGGDREQGEILINSSHGSWGYQWGNLGLPLKYFLTRVSFDYLMGKLLRGDLREFDQAASEKAWKIDLLRARRERDLDQDQANEVWNDSMDSNPCSAEGFIHRLATSQPLELRGHGLWDDLPHYIVSRVQPAAVNFWNDLWPVFVEQLQSEAVPANEARMA
jgi:hypothetical protein